MQPANSAGLNWIARHDAGCHGSRGRVEKIDAFPTSHHVAWADLDGDGKKELLNAPLLGPKERWRRPTTRTRRRCSGHSPKDWKRHVVTADIPGIIHRVRPVMWDAATREQFLVASFEGIALYRASGTGDGDDVREAAAVARATKKKRRASARATSASARRTANASSPRSSRGTATRSSIYTESGGAWKRRVIFDKVASGHESRRRRPERRRPRRLSWRTTTAAVTEQNPNATPGVHVFFAPADAATRRVDSIAGSRTRPR